MARLTKEVDLDGRKVTVNELTVAEVRAWFKGLESINAETFDALGEGLLAEASFSDVARMSDLTVEEMEDLTPSSIQNVVAVCKEVNPHFFKLRDRLMEAAQAIPKTV